MLKTLTKLEIVIEGRLYQFLCDYDSPVFHVKESLFQFTKMVGRIEEELLKEQKKEESEEIKPPPEKNEL